MQLQSGSGYFNFGNNDRRLYNFNDSSVKYVPFTEEEEKLYEFSPTIDNVKEKTKDNIKDNAPTYDNPLRSTQTYQGSGDSNENITSADIEEMMRSVLGEQESVISPMDTYRQIQEQNQSNQTSQNKALEEAARIRSELRDTNRANSRIALDQSIELGSAQNQLNNQRTGTLSDAAWQAQRNTINSASQLSTERQLDSIAQYNQVTHAQRQLDAQLEATAKLQSQALANQRRENALNRGLEERMLDKQLDYNAKQSKLNWARSLQSSVINSLGSRGGFAYW